MKVLEQHGEALILRWNKPVFGLRWIRRARITHVVRYYDGLFPKAVSVPVVQVVGDPGSTVVLHLGEFVVTYEEPRREILDVRDIVEAAEIIAKRLGVPLQSSVRPTEWDRWKVDLSYRAYKDFQRERRHSDAEQLRVFRTPAHEPASADLTLEGFRWKRYTLTPRTVSDEFNTVPLHTIRDGYVKLDGLDLSIRLRLVDKCISFGVHEPPHDVAEFNWMMTQILQAARRARNERGEASEIPENLDFLVKS